VNIAEQRLVLPLLADFFFFFFLVCIAIAVVLEKLHTDTENLVGTGSQGLLPWSEEAGGTKVIGTRYERRTTKNEAYRFQWRKKKKKKKEAPSLSRSGTKEEEKTEGKEEGITGWLAVLGTCAGCSRVLSKEARYVSVSFDSFFASETLRGKKLGFVLAAAAVIISTRTTARLLHDLLSLRLFKFIDWKEFVGTGSERKGCSLPLFV
jgi:hypothetical protein